MSLCFLSSPSSRAITARSPWDWVSQPSMLSEPAMKNYGTRHALCAVPAVNCLWTWSTSGRKTKCTADVTTETVRSLDVQAVMRWSNDFLSFFEISGFADDCVVVGKQSTFCYVYFHSWSSAMSTLKQRGRTGIWSISAVSNVTASWLERRMWWRKTSLSAHPATWKTMLWWVSFLSTLQLAHIKDFKYDWNAHLWRLLQAPNWYSQTSIMERLRKIAACELPLVRRYESSERRRRGVGGCSGTNQTHTGLNSPPTGSTSDILVPDTTEYRQASYSPCPGG